MEVSKNFFDPNAITEKLDLSKKIRQNSPFTITAIKNCGADINDIIDLTFKEYKELHPELQNLPKEIQIRRYEFFEKLRNDKIEEIIIERQKIIEEGGEENNQGSQITRNNNIADVQTALINEQKSIEKLKYKHEKELLTAIQNELKNEISRRKIQKKLQTQRESDEKYYDSNMGKSDITEKRQKSEEIKMRNSDYRQQIERMFEERQSKIVERQKIYEEKEEERRLIIENKIKIQQIKTKKKKEEKKRKIEMTMKNLEDKMKKRTDELEFKQLKNESKRIEFEESRQRKFNSRKDQAVKKGELILQVLERNKEMEKRKIKEYYDKQAIISLRKEELEEIQHEEKRIRDQKSLERQRKIDEVFSFFKQALKNNEIQIDLKKNSILQRIHENERKKSYFDKIKERDIIERNESKTLKNFMRIQNIKKINKLNEYSKEKNSKFFEEKFKRFQDFNSQKHKLKEVKREISTEVSNRKLQILMKLDLMFKKDILSEDTFTELEDMFKDNEELLKLVEMLRETVSFDTLERSKSLFNNKSKLKKNQVVDTKSQGIFATELSTLKEDKINTKISEENKKNILDIPIIIEPNHSNKEMPEINSDNVFANKQNTLHRNSKSQRMKYQLNNIPSKKEDIDKKIYNYRLILNQDLLKILGEERNREEERERRLCECTSDQEKIKLEKLYGVERALASNKIVNFNKEIEMKVREFEMKLKTAFI